MPEITWNDIVRKLTSRKFWMAVAAFVTDLMVFMGSTDEVIVKVVALIMSGAAVVAYIIGEGLADSSPTVNEDHWYIEPEELEEIEE